MWYIPHHGVSNPNKDKLRVVFDCAAVYNGTSLNKHLLSGPNLTNNLVDVLLKFREHAVAIMGDVEAMFHQVRVPADERDYLRFLWWPGGDTNAEPRDYRMSVHLFGATSSPSCANMALRQTARDHGTEFDGSVTETVNNNFYVDDCLKSIENEEKAIKLMQDLTALLAKGGFNITKFTSNNRAVIDSILPEKRAKSVRQLDIKADTLPLERALGVYWNTETDSFCFKIKLLEKKPTRRNILSLTSTVFDPMGFVSPFIMPAKLVLQNLCRMGLDWD